MRMFNRVLYGLLVVTAVLAPTATAGSGSAVRTYGGPGANVQGQVDTQTTGTLPFTGLDVAVLVVAGLLMLSVGIVIRRLGRNRA
jgi:hypothetical protein